MSEPLDAVARAFEQALAQAHPGTTFRVTIAEVDASALVDAGVVAELLGVPKSWVAAEARANRIPHVHLGHYVRFNLETIGRWWRARQDGPVAAERDAA